MALDAAAARYLIFDLDDTLFDTLGQLVEPASREACAAMVNAGLNAEVDACVKRRREIFATNPRANVYHELVTFYGLTPGADSKTVVSAGEKAFYDREIGEKLELFPDALATLKELSRNLTLFLVTLGSPRTQKQKVEALDLKPLFKKVVYVDVARRTSKAPAFRELLNETKALPREFVSIGNRIDGDIGAGKELGMQAILMVHGEYTHLKPQHAFEEPDARIHALSELVTIFRGSGP